ncbi:hypothetical protein P43SY_000399 [Pythium insidiosum]|uniref:NADAR domain-containing protein n=1 Tax=Pythium insidiosum TaxID=114742 RepID=A0AAD5QD95_PYTIN|nr:hypothetical protein P43SY_000399 [Pythium insidiosum]
MPVETHRAIYFYANRDEQYGYMSNFHPCSFVGPDGHRYKSSEQYFMKKKQETFDPNNDAIALAIRRAKTPSDAKKLGRRVQNYDDEVWDAKRFGFMVEALQLKFGSDPELATKLLATGDKMLYEASRNDAIWGIGISVEGVRELFRSNSAFLADGDIDDATQHQVFGQNLLGKALVAVRSSLREQSDSET